MAHREAQWGKLMGDPDWIRARAETEVKGPLVERITNQFWRPTPYSALK